MKIVIFVIMQEFRCQSLLQPALSPRWVVDVLLSAFHSTPLYANLCYQRSYDKRRLTEHLIVDLAFIFAALQRKGSGPHKRRAQEGDEENLSRSSHIINASSEI